MQKEEPDVVTYGKTITWRSFGGLTVSAAASGCSSPEEAEREALDYAKQMGWTPAKWWQWWRWRDSK